MGSMSLMSWYSWTDDYKSVAQSTHFVCSVCKTVFTDSNIKFMFFLVLDQLHWRYSKSSLEIQALSFSSALKIEKSLDQDTKLHGLQVGVNHRVSAVPG